MEKKRRGQEMERKRRGQEMEREREGEIKRNREGVGGGGERWSGKWGGRWSES